MVADRGGSPFVGKVINEAMREMQAMVAVFTPDEYASLRETHRRGHDRPEDVERWQARPNVLLEAGMALAIDEDRTIFVILGKVSVPSDIEGRHLVRMSNDAPSRNVLKTRLEGVGCDVKAQSDWLHSGDFDGAVAGLSYDPPGASPSKPDPKLEGGATAPAMSDEAVRMKLVAWLMHQDREMTDVRGGTPTEFTVIDQEAGVPFGGAERLLTKAYGDKWTELERGGGHVRLERQPERVRDVRGGSRYSGR